MAADKSKWIEWQTLDELANVSPPAKKELALLRAENAALVRRLDWIEQNLFERHWGGTIGRPSVWYVRGDYRHTMKLLRGETLIEAIDAALAAGEKKE